MCPVFYRDHYEERQKEKQELARISGDKDSNGRYVCYVCGKEIEPGEEVWARPWGRSGDFMPCHRDHSLRMGTADKPRRKRQRRRR